jgi:putative zinc finger/helix-turn-helix YgiT family protein
MKHTCVFCGHLEVVEVVYDERVTAGRRKVAVTGLRKMECSSCGHEYVEQDQLSYNQSLIEATSVTPGQVGIGLLRNLRDRWALTQRAASNLFGAGQNSFAKWESGQLPSGPTALLLQCAANVPGVVEYLARLNKATLPSCPELLDWEDDSGEVTGYITVLVRSEKMSRNTQTRAKPNMSSILYAQNVVELYGEAA